MNLYTADYRHRGGFTLVEVMVSFVILGILATVIGMWIVSNNIQLNRADVQNRSNYVAQRILDSLQVMGISSVKSMDTVRCRNADSIPYTCVYSATTVDSTNMVIAKKVQVKVSYKVGSWPFTTTLNGVIQ